MTLSDPALWTRISAHPLDVPGAALPFSRRLARENGWTAAFAARAILEYRRFVYLALVSSAPVTPSDEVDQVWHLHLQYTEDYWDRFCPQVLGRPLHHGPTSGGGAEGRRYRDQYLATLALYAEQFDAAPPADIWPPADMRFGRAPNFRRVNTKEVLMIPLPRGFKGPVPPAFRAAGVVLAGAVLAGLTLGAAPVAGMTWHTMLWVAGGFAVFFILAWIGSFFANPDGKFDDKGGPVIPFHTDNDGDEDHDA